MHRPEPTPAPDVQDRLRRARRCCRESSTRTCTSTSPGAPNGRASRPRPRGSGDQRRDHARRHAAQLDPADDNARGVRRQAIGRARAVRDRRRVLGRRRARATRAGSPGLVADGVRGFKCFLVDGGVAEFRLGRRARSSRPRCRSCAALGRPASRARRARRADRRGDRGARRAPTRTATRRTSHRVHPRPRSRRSRSSRGCAARTRARTHVVHHSAASRARPAPRGARRRLAAVGRDLPALSTFHRRADPRRRDAVQGARRRSATRANREAPGRRSPRACSISSRAITRRAARGSRRWIRATSSRRGAACPACSSRCPSYGPRRRGARPFARRRRALDVAPARRELAGLDRHKGAIAAGLRRGSRRVRRRRAADDHRRRRAIRHRHKLTPYLGETLARHGSRDVSARRARRRARARVLATDLRAPDLTERRHFRDLPDLARRSRRRRPPSRATTSSSPRRRTSCARTPPSGRGRNTPIAASGCKDKLGDAPLSHRRRRRGGRDGNVHDWCVDAARPARRDPRRRRRHRVLSRQLPRHLPHRGGDDRRPARPRARSTPRRWLELVPRSQLEGNHQEPVSDRRATSASRTCGSRSIPTAASRACACTARCGRSSNALRGLGGPDRSRGARARRGGRGVQRHVLRLAHEPRQAGAVAQHGRWLGDAAPTRAAATKWAIMRARRAPARSSALEVDTSHFKGNAPALCTRRGTAPCGSRRDARERADGATFAWRLLLRVAAAGAHAARVRRPSCGGSATSTYVRLSVVSRAAASRGCARRGDAGLRARRRHRGSCARSTR